jgi:hypothetical protein
MAVDKGAPSQRKSPKAAGLETTGTRAQRTTRAAGTRETQRSGRRLSPSEHAVLQAMIAEAEAMRRRLTATE